MCCGFGLRASFLAWWLPACNLPVPCIWHSEMEPSTSTHEAAVGSGSVAPVMNLRESSLRVESMCSRSAYAIIQSEGFDVACLSCLTMPGFQEVQGFTQQRI